jgi:sulfur relay protein TusB/DsrH
VSLHCLGKADEAAATRLAALVGEGDAVLLVGAAVPCARRGHALLEGLAASGAALHALEEDLLLYGVQPVDERVAIVDYAGWVDLATRHERQLQWR